MKRLTNLKPKMFEANQIAHIIQATPERKWAAAQAVVNWTDKVKDAKREVKKVKAAKRLEANNNKEIYPASDDRKAFVENHEDVEKAEIELIHAEAQLTAAKLAYECLDDLFTAGKKIMEYITKQDLAERQYDRFVNEGRKNEG